MKNRKQILLWLLLPTGLFAQEPVSLHDCQQWAREQHPLLPQKELYQQMSGLKLANNASNYLPEAKLNAQATYQSDVTGIKLSMPGIDVPTPSKDQYKVYVDVRQNIWDGGLTKANEILEKAQLEANRQTVETEVYQLREQVNTLFFSSFLLQKNLEMLSKKQETLEAQQKKMESGVRNGMVLQSDLDLILAELLKNNQQQTELQASRETILSALAILTGKSIPELQNLVLATGDPTFGAPLARPELELFEKQSESLEASAGLLQKKRNPKVFGFGQAGYGKPGLNMLSDKFDSYYLLGLGLNWNIFDWKTTKREKEIIRLQQEMVDTKQQQFERNIQIALDREQRKINQLQEILESDRQLIELQERIVKSSASKLENGNITTSDYIQDVNAETAARITFETHQVQLEEAKINYQNIQGSSF